jgi:SAM-dependent methyltransferase
MDYKNIVRVGYDAIAEKYLASRRCDGQDIRLLGELIARLPAGAEVLDAGCGAGMPIDRILSRTFAVTGVDFSTVQIELAKRNVPGATFICQDMTTLDFPADSFDAICSYYAIIHVPRQEHWALLHKFQHMLKPSGLALLCLGAESLVDDIEDDYLGFPMYWSHYDADTYLGMLQDCGFDLLWSRHVADETSPGASHLFVLAQKGARG